VNRAERVAATLFLIAAAAAAGLGAVYSRGGNPQREGLLLFTGLVSLGAGFVVWAHHLLPKGPHEQPRHPLESEPEQRDAFEADFERGGVIPRRTWLKRSLGTAIVAFAGAALFPIRSLGPRPGRSLFVTPWRNGRRLVTDDGTPVRADSIPVDGIATVFPEGFAGSADGQAIVIRLPANLLTPVAGRESWTPDGLIAFSKVCTHAGCPVGLYQADSHQLLCPCHQSAFDVLDRAKPVTGPAAAPLPQLPLAVDGDGFVRATGDFSDPIGPAFWRRT